MKGIKGVVCKGIYLNMKSKRDVSGSSKKIPDYRSLTILQLSDPSVSFTPIKFLILTNLKNKGLSYHLQSAELNGVWVIKNYPVFLSTNYPKIP